MANRLAELNRSKRDFAYSGRADIGDVPWLYALQAAQAEANAPAGIGEQGGMASEAAPNPMAPAAVGGGQGGGGTTGGADTGLVGPGQSGLGEDFDQALRAYYEGGGQAGEPGGAGAGSVEFGDPNMMVDPTVAELVGVFGPSVIGLVGSLGAMGMRGHNAGIMDSYLGGIGLEGLDFSQIAGAALGTNPYGGGTEGSIKDALDASIASTQAGSDNYIGGYSTENVPGGAWGQGAGVGGVPTPDQIAGFLGGTPPGGAAESSRGGASVSSGRDIGGGPSQGRGGIADRGLGRSAARGSGGQDSGRSGVGESGGSYGGGGGGGSSRAERGGGGGWAGPGSIGGGGGGAGVDGPMGQFHEGGYLHEGMVPGEHRADVPVTMQEGEGVLTADAMEMLGGPGFVHGVNMMAKMMRGR